MLNAVAIYNPVLKLETFSILAWHKGQEQCYDDKYPHILNQGTTPGHAKILLKKVSAECAGHLLLRGTLLVYWVGKIFLYIFY